MQDHNLSSSYVSLSEILSKQYVFQQNGVRFVPSSASDSVDRVYGLNSTMVPLVHRTTINVKYQIDEICKVIRETFKNFSKYLKTSLDGYEWKIRDEIFEIATIWGANVERSMQRVYNFSEEFMEISFPLEIGKLVSDLLEEFINAFQESIDHAINNITELPGGKNLSDWIEFKKKYSDRTTNYEALYNMYIREQMQKARVNKPWYISWILVCVSTISIVIHILSVFYCVYLVTNISPRAVFLFILKWNGILLLLLLSIFHGYILYEATNDPSKQRKSFDKSQDASVKSSITITSNPDSSPPNPFKPDTRRVLSSNDLYRSNDVDTSYLKEAQSLTPNFKNRLTSNSMKSKFESDRIPSFIEKTNMQSNLEKEESQSFEDIAIGYDNQQKRRRQPKFLFAILGGIQFLVGSFCVFPLGRWIPEESPYYDIIHYFFPFASMALITSITYLICSLHLVSILRSLVHVCIDFYEFSTFPSIKTEWLNKRYSKKIYK